MKKVLCLVFILMFAISVTAYATPYIPDFPYACSCGGINEYTGSEIGNWVATPSQRACLHGYSSGYDYRCYRDVTYYYNCVYCGKSGKVSYREVEWLCSNEIYPLSVVYTVN